jgi:hypothetical protein
LEHPAELVRRGGLGAQSCDLQLDGEREQVLLRAVVEVAFKAAPLLVARIHQAGPRSAHGTEVAEQFGTEPLVGERERPGATQRTS